MTGAGGQGMMNSMQMNAMGSMGIMPPPMTMPGMPMGYGGNPMMMASSQFGHQIPGQGYMGANGKMSVYPIRGMHSTSMYSPYSMHNYGGYDPFGFPMVHPGVPSSTPLPPTGGEAAKKA